MGFKNVLLHDNTLAYTSANVLQKEGVTVLPQSPYSPDLTPCDLFFFPKLKTFLAGRRYRSRQAIGSTYTNTLPVYLKQRTSTFRKLFHRLK